MPIRLAVPLPGPFVWMRGRSQGPGCLTVVGLAIGLPLILMLLALAAAVYLLYILGQIALIAYDELVVMADDWTTRRRNADARRKKTP